MSQPFTIETHGLAKSFGGGTGVTGIDLRVAKNSIVGFLGPNGAGKSTTIKLLLGLIRPTGGTGRVFGHDIITESLAIRGRVGYLAQDPRFYDHMTARETLRFTARFFYQGPAAAIRARADEALELVGLQDRADRPIRHFSGGERQRLGIAQAQINRPDLLILDEPAAALDPMGRRDVLEIMGRLRQRCTIFYSTHILDDVQRISDAVAILNRGQLVAQAPIGELLGGSGKTVYTLTVRGASADAEARLAQQPWVSGVEVERPTGHWQVTVADEDAAEELLLRLILSDGRCRVTEFGKVRYDLESVFLGLVEGGAGHDR